MTTRYGYYAMQYAEVIDNEIKYWATVERIPRNYNLLSYCRNDKIKVMMNCATFKEAKETVRAWNEAYKNNGVRAY